MSAWTHVVAVYHIETYSQEENIKEYVQNLLKNSPKITGSQSNADVFVNVLSGHNASTNVDCKHCTYVKTIIHHPEGGLSCEAPKEYKCPTGEYQTCVTITVVGNLRDRTKACTKREIQEFERFLRLKKKGCGFKIENKSVRIIGY